MGGYFGHFWAVGFIRPSGHTFRPRQRTAFLLRAGRPRGKRGYGLRDKSRSRISAKRSCAAGISTRKSTVDSLALSRSGELCANAACSRPTSESSNKQRMIRRSLLTAESTSARTHSLRMLFWDITTMNLSHQCSAALATVLYCLDPPDLRLQEVPVAKSVVDNRVHDIAVNSTLIEPSVTDEQTPRVEVPEVGVIAVDGIGIELLTVQILLRIEVTGGHRILLYRVESGSWGYWIQAYPQSPHVLRKIVAARHLRHSRFVGIADTNRVTSR